MKKFFLFLAACVALVACNKKSSNESAPVRQITIHATADMNSGSSSNSGAHKIAPDDITASSVSFHWNEGDKVWVMTEDGSEMQLFTIDNSSINGNQADFIGTSLSDMSSYIVAYMDNDVNPETLIALLHLEATTLNYNPTSQNWVFLGEGSEDNFTLQLYYTNIRMQLKGECKLGKVVYLPMSEVPGVYQSGTSTINFVHGEYDGLQLSSTPVEVTMPAPEITPYGFAIRFYDTDDNKITEKTQTGNAFYNAFSDAELVNLGVLEVKATPVLPAGALPGEFSVSTTKKVHFSQGNLWADNSNVLHFEDAQWKSATTLTANHVSHFTWSDNIASAVSTTNSGSYLFCDESHKQAVDGSDAVYYALSMEEWTYLFRRQHSTLYKSATVNGVHGYVIAPDGFTGTLASSYADDAALAADNLLFLPDAGLRWGVELYSGDGNYWSSSLDPENVNMAFEVWLENNVYLNYTTGKTNGLSIRLVTDAN